ncbi:MAG: hybrid sensor histidine kinase/response regulator [Acidovorax sp.]|uniref:hybrid sensor histidine kinase/response regulator n=1 Tax=Acidovorax sp. TaxID=1872122 RepID=UPI00261F2052|nr:hybrid sensor histidine kinase/response regulator [Acidovorax sp.]MDH4464527.1 hybrid sensor histidine kinase/response regulator [Acidovorax sp.]
MDTSFWRRWFPRPLDSGELGERGHVRMLELTHQRLVLSICAMPLLGAPLTMWFQGLGRDPLGLGLWTALYTVAALAVWHQARRLRHSRRSPQAQDDALWLAQWRPRVRATSLIHALGLAALGAIVVATPGRAHYDFILLLHVTLAVVIVGNATFQLPSVGMFLRMYGLGWGVATVVLPVVLMQWPSLMHGPGDAGGGDASPWRFIIPVSLLLLIALYRHAVVANNFFVQQVRLEEEGLHLAREARLAHEKAEAALVDKNLFLRTASHDLRQPVHAMGFQIEAIRQRNQDPALTPALEDLRRSVQSVHLMFNALLDLSRIENRALPERRVPVALAPLLGDMAQLFREEAAGLGLALRLRVPAGGATVLADPVLLRQSLVNLVHNALRYTGRGGLLLAVRKRGSDWCVEVWDTGLGVAPEDHARIYEPFYRPAHTAPLHHAGHGLGLAVVARCAELMGAAHGMRSRPGRGSCFWLRLPAAPDAPPDDGDATPETTTFSRMAGRCLVVDDDPHVLRAWSSMMASWGLEIRTASDAAAALTALDAGFEPDAIFCDQRLRNGDSGFDVLRALLARSPRARGAMVSGELDAPELAAAQAQGYLVLAKPVDVAALHALLEQWLLRQPESSP